MSTEPIPEPPSAPPTIDMALRERYAPPAYEVLFEIPNATGGRHNRTADALAFSLWPSRGLEIYGFEIKCHRSDWLRELKDPHKAETFWRYCDRWFLVVNDKSVVQAGELPKTWGLLALSGGKLKLVVDAPPNPEPRPLDRLLLMALVRSMGKRLSEMTPTREIRQELTKSYLEGVKVGEQKHKDLAAYNEKRYTELRAQVCAFEKRAGLNELGGVEAYRWEARADVVRIMQGLSDHRLEGGLGHLADTCKEILTSIAAYQARVIEAAKELGMKAAAEEEE